MEQQDKLLYLKKGDVKKNLISFVLPCEYRFYADKIIIRPYSWNRLINSKDDVILKEDILNIKDGMRVLGYNIIIETKSVKYTCSFLGDKLKIKQLLEMYV